jgi:ABC-type branched-subunit amino acid transport system substrate-binding protein
MNQTLRLLFAALPRLAAVALLSTSTPAGAAETLDVRIAWTGNTDSSAYRGAEQGIEEANRQGRFLGQKYTLEIVAPDELRGSNTVAIVTDAGSEALVGLADSANGRPVFNVATTADADRALCLPNLFHLLPSESMKAAALAQWQASSDGAPGAAVAWNPGFTRYAASQLNKRYGKTHDGEAMDDAAWAGWAAVKLYSDAVARVGVEPAAMVPFLREELAFDGQKGVDMSFRSSGQLRQVILIEHDGEVVGETPVRGKDLDSLGGGDCPPS